MITLIRIVSEPVVFETVDGTVVVHIEAEEKLWSVGAIAQKGLFVIGKVIAVLVEVVDKVAVLVVAGPGLVVPQAALHDIASADFEVGALPFGRGVVIVVVVDELVKLRHGVLVADPTFFIDEPVVGGVFVGDRKTLGIQREGLQVPGGLRVCRGGVYAVFEVFFFEQVGILEEAAVEDQFAIC